MKIGREIKRGKEENWREGGDKEEEWVSVFFLKKVTLHQ